MSATTAAATSGKVDLLKGDTDFDNAADAIKAALIKTSMAGTYGAASTNYSDITGNSDEASGSGYSAGGNTLTNVNPTSSGTTAYTDFSDTQWTTATISARAVMLYNSSNSNAAVSVHDFGADKSSSAGTFTIQFPTADASNAIYRLA